MYSIGEKIALALLALILIPTIVFMLCIIFIYMPVSLSTEASCLRQGYPKYAVSIGLERYCMNLDGTVTVKVDHQR